MKLTKMQGFAGVCCLLVPFALGAQADSTMSQDKDFLTKASAGGMAEVKFGELAAEKASDPKLKKFGNKMVTDHTLLNNELKPFADKNGVLAPTGLMPDDQAEYDKLNGLSGADFDKEYAAAMEKDHAKDLTDFKQEASTTQDTKLKAVVMKGEKVIAQHQRMIDQIGTSIGVPPASGM